MVVEFCAGFGCEFIHDVVIDEGIVHAIASINATEMLIAIIDFDKSGVDRDIFHNVVDCVAA